MQLSQQQTCIYIRLCYHVRSLHYRHDGSIYGRILKRTKAGWSVMAQWPHHVSWKSINWLRRRGHTHGHDETICLPLL